MHSLFKFLNKNPLIKSAEVNLGLLILRISFSYAIIVLHGWPKLQSLLTGNTSEFPDPIGLGNEVSIILAIFAELICSIMVIIGFKMRWAVIPIIITMIIATWVINGGKPFLYQEKPFVFLAAYTCLFFTGSGKYSLEYFFLKKGNIRY